MIEIKADHESFGRSGYRTAWTKLVSAATAMKVEERHMKRRILVCFRRIQANVGAQASIPLSLTTMTYYMIAR